MEDTARVSRAADYEFELTASREEVSTVLSGVTDGILTGAIRLGDGDDAVNLSVPDDISLEIELETEEDELSLELELEWPAPDDESTNPAVTDRSGEIDEAPAIVGAADTTQSVARFEVFRDRNEEWRWRLRHHNGNIIATSGEGYTQKHNAQNGLRSVVENSPEAEISEGVTN